MCKINVRFFSLVCLKQMKSTLFVDGMPIESLVVLQEKQFQFAGNLMAMSDPVIKMVIKRRNNDFSLQFSCT